MLAAASDGAASVSSVDELGDDGSLPPSGVSYILDPF